jgi:hypothetical protein
MATPRCARRQDCERRHRSPWRNRGLVIRQKRRSRARDSGAHTILTAFSRRSRRSRFGRSAMLGAPVQWRQALIDVGTFEEEDETRSALCASALGPHRFVQSQVLQIGMGRNDTIYYATATYSCCSGAHSSTERHSANTQAITLYSRLASKSRSLEPAAMDGTYYQPPIFTPDPRRAAASQLADFIRFCSDSPDRDFANQTAFHEFSTKQFRTFWRRLLDWSDLPVDGDAHTVCTDDLCESARFFPDLRLNYAEVLLAGDPTRPALVTCHRDAPVERLSRGELRGQVARLAASLLSLGVVARDRIGPSRGIPACWSGARYCTIWALFVGVDGPLSDKYWNDTTR